MARRQLRQIQLAFLARVIIKPMLGTGSLFFANFNHIKSSGGFGSSAFGSSTTQSNSGFSTFGSVAQMAQSDAPKANPFGSSTTPGLAC